MLTYFPPVILSYTIQPAASSTARFIILSDDETDAILKSAHECAESECSVDDVSNLVSELKGQEVEMKARLGKITSMIAELEHLSAKEQRNKDDVKAFVKDMLRVFSHGEVSDNNVDNVNIIISVGETPPELFDGSFLGWAHFSNNPFF